MDIKNMQEEELKNAIRKVVQENFGLDEVSDDADFVKDLKIDSIGTMELLLKLEDEFGVRVEDKDAQKITNVASAAKLLKQLAE